MTISLFPVKNASFPAVAPASAAIWEPVRGRSGAFLEGDVRTLTFSNEAQGEGGSRGYDVPRWSSGTPARRSAADRLTTYLVGGLFGLSMVLGTMFLTEGADASVEPAPSVHAGASGTSVASASR